MLKVDDVSELFLLWSHLVGTKMVQWLSCFLVEDLYGFFICLGFLRCSDWFLIMKCISSFILLFESSTGSRYELSSSLQPAYHSSWSEVFKSLSWQELDCKGLSLIISIFSCNLFGFLFNFRLRHLGYLLLLFSIELKI
jgi:hypothetical protein